MKKLKILLLKNLVSVYSNITVTTQKSEEEWYKQSVQIDRYFYKRKSDKLLKSDISFINKKTKELQDFDGEYFEKKDFSSYICMVFFLDYLIKEITDLEMRSKFGYYDVKTIIHDIETNDALRSVAFDTHKYVTKALKIIGV